MRETVGERRAGSPRWEALARLIENSPFFDRHGIVAAGTEPGVRAGLELGVATLAVQAQDYPTKTVTVVVPFPAGGSSDMIGRVLAPLPVRAQPSAGTAPHPAR